MQFNLKVLGVVLMTLFIVMPSTAQINTLQSKSVKCKAVRDYDYWGVQGYNNGSLVFDIKNTSVVTSSEVDEVRVFGPFEWYASATGHGVQTSDDYPNNSAAASSVTIPSGTTFTAVKNTAKKYQGIAYYETDYGITTHGAATLRPVYFSKDEALDVSSGTIPIKSIKIGANCKCKIDLSNGGSGYETDADALKNIETYTAEVLSKFSIGN